MTTDQFDTPGAAGGDTGEFDRFGRYRLPHPLTGKATSWTRVTTYAKSIADTYALTKWQMRMCVKGLASRPDLFALAASTPIDDKDALDSIAEDAKEAAAASAGANTGTALHTFSEQLDRGENPTVPAPWDADIRAYQTTLAGHGIRIDPQYIECKVVIPDIGVAGTFDRLVQHNGDLVVGDLKTGKNLDFGWLEIAIQLALYSRATHLWDRATRTHRPMPQVDQTRALVFHLPVGKATCTVYEVDIAAGWAAAELCGHVRDWRKRKGLASPLPAVLTPAASRDPLAGLKRQSATNDLKTAINAATSVDDLTAIWAAADAAGQWNTTLTAAAAARKNVLATTGQASK